MERTGDPASAGDAEGVAETLDRPLPEGVRRRVVSLVADAFGGLTVTELPAQLRQYARFTPTRRAKFAGNAMAAAVESDPVFRQRIAGRLRETQQELAEAVEGGSPPAAADPEDVAALAFVLRPAGWVKLVEAAGEEAQRASAERAGEEAERELRRLREELAEVRATARTEVERSRGELEAARKESDALHRKLRSALSDVKRGEAALRKAASELESVRSAAAVRQATAEGEARRLRARLAETES
ncbi:MAG: RNA-binding protein, partial [Streptomyces sp.]|nr:RNA-binding protein [Streptomyces sp.]